MSDGDNKQGPDALDALEQLGFGASFLSELASMLEKAVMFAKFERADLELLAHYCNAYGVSAPQVLFKEADKGHFMAVLLKGRIDIIKGGKHIATVRPGRALGEMSLIDGYPCSATAKVVENAEIAMFTRMQFEQLCHDHPALGLKVMRSLAGLISLRLRQTTGILLDHL
jgi:CRP-like cAMP-binding protein